jgi:hypothetical protein
MFTRLVNKAKLKVLTNSVVYLERGKIGEKSVWYFIEVSRLKEPLYQRIKPGSLMNLSDYGQVILSGYGLRPPQAVEDWIQEKYK